MYIISVLDDLESEISRVKKLLEAYHKLNPNFIYKLNTFNSYNELENMMLFDDTIDLIFLDIFIDQDHGIDVAKKLRNKGYKNAIIFFTTSKDYAISAFSVDALQYLLKPLQQEDFINAMDKFIEKYQPVETTLVLKVSGETRKINRSQIIFTETKGHYQNIYLTNKEILTVRITGKLLMENLDSKLFVQLGKTYILNISLIEKFTAKVVTLKTNAELFIPRGAYKILKDKYMSYYSELS